MSLRRKTLLLVGVSLAGLLVVLGITSRFILGRSFANLEEKDASVNVERVLNAVSNELLDLKSTTEDWAHWTDTYEFVQGTYRGDYAKTNLYDGSLATLRVNFMVFIDPIGQVIYGKAIDLESNSEIPFSSRAAEPWPGSNLLLQHPDTKSVKTGLVLLPEGPALVASAPITRSDEAPPIGGTLIVGRFLDSAMIATLSERTRLSLVVQQTPHFQGDANTPGVLSRLQKEAIVIEPLDGETIAGYALVKDISDTPFLVFQVDMPRAIHRQGQSTIRYFMMSLLGVGLTFSVIIALSLEKMVLSRVAHLGAGVRSIGTRRDLSVRLSLRGRDELAGLKDAINSMMDALNRAQSDQQLAQEELAKRAAALQAANNELEVFALSVSHDLRAPLRSIEGFSLALLEDYGGKIEARGLDYLQRMRAGVQRMGRLIDDILTLSRVSRSQMRSETVHLSEMAQSIAEDLKRTQPERQVEFIIAPKLVAKGDSELLKLVLENLLGNAWKYTSKHARAKIELGITGQNGLGAYFVRDNGAGFDMAYADKLFGVFQRLHSLAEFPGTGVGLATVQRIIHRHGGRVWAEGKVEQGATFYFILEQP